MLGPVFLALYPLINAFAWCLPRASGLSLRARWLLRFVSLSDGGLDDDFTEQLFLLIREEPSLLQTLTARLHGNGFTARRQRLILQDLAQAHAAGCQTTF
jgi:hypothetical protein